MHLIGFIIRINISLYMMFRFIGGGTGGLVEGGVGLGHLCSLCV